jgi:hypothetical protein
MLRNYYGDFENNNKEIVCLEIRCTNLSLSDSPVHVYTANLNREKLGTVFKTIVEPDETFMDLGKTIVGVGEMLICEANSLVEFKIGVNEDVL